jgi:hypothetical protein
VLIGVSRRRRGVEVGALLAVKDMAMIEISKGLTER